VRTAEILTAIGMLHDNRTPFSVKLRGRCPGCGTERALPGRRPSDQATICAGCAGLSD
jgi:hypothetical protein